jgi:outer membrane protein TolC
MFTNRLLLNSTTTFFYLKLRPLIVLGFLTSVLGGCATYHAKPLTEKNSLIPKAKALTVKTETIPLQQLKNVKVNLNEALDWREVSVLALSNNPGLKAGRMKLKEAKAQAYDASLFPDPQLSLTADKPTSDVGGLVTANSLGLGVDLQSIITHGANLDAAKADADAVNLSLVWDAWQVVQQARMLVVKRQVEQKKIQLLKTVSQQYADRNARTQRLLNQGDLTLESAGAAMSAWLDANSRLSNELVNESRLQNQLNALLGLSPKADLSLVPLPVPDNTLDENVQQIDLLPKRRPDLLALQAAYRSQENRVRQAILAQFPAINIGYTRAKDTAGVQTNGLGIVLNLPFFSGNRGKIEVQRATRERLYAEYQTRLNSSLSDIAEIQSREKIVRDHYQKLLQHLPDLKKLAVNARKSYRLGDMRAIDLLNIETSLLDKQLERIGLEGTLWEARIALDSLLAWQSQGKGE